MSIARVTEIKASSTKSFDDAIKAGVARAQKTLTNVRSAWIENQEVLIDDKGQISEYRVQMKVTFILED
ncbi:MAG: dodecin domain-containing protein [Geobacteraceae bacterium]|jgi:flavin-binding protein dodecin|nr:MAG: dodecin domain-containing protein [Geobacteraceae bacterium]